MEGRKLKTPSKSLWAHPSPPAPPSAAFGSRLTVPLPPVVLFLLLLLRRQIINEGQFLPRRRSSFPLDLVNAGFSVLRGKEGMGKSTTKRRERKEESRCYLLLVRVLSLLRQTVTTFSFFIFLSLSLSLLFASSLKVLPSSCSDSTFIQVRKCDV